MTPARKEPDKNTYSGRFVAQLGLNAAWTYFLAATGLIVIVAIIAGLVLAVKSLASWWFSCTDATEKAAEKTKMLQDITEKYKNSLKETVDEHKKMIDTINKWNEAAKSPAQKAAERGAELQNAINEPIRLQQEINKMQAIVKGKEEHIAVLQKDNNKKNAEHLAEQLKILDETKTRLQELQDIQSKSKPLTAEAKEAWEASNRKNFAADAGLDITERMSNDAVLDSKIEAIKAAIERNDQRNELTAKETQIAIDNMIADYRKAEGVDEMVKPFKTAGDILDENNNRLKKWLDDGIINAAEYANGLKRASDKFANTAGIDKFFDVSDTLEGRQAALAETFANMEIYAKHAGKTGKELADAQQKAAKAMLGQTEAGKMLQDAMEAIGPATDRLFFQLADHSIP